MSLCAPRFAPKPHAPPAARTRRGGGGGLRACLGQKALLVGGWECRAPSPASLPTGAKSLAAPVASGWLEWGGDFSNLYQRYSECFSVPPSTLTENLSLDDFCVRDPCPLPPVMPRRL